MSRFSDYEIFPMGDQGILIKWSSYNDPEFLRYMRAKRDQLLMRFEQEVIQAYHELLLKVAPSSTTIKEVDRLLQQEVAVGSHSSLTHIIPVCYEADYAPDLHAFAKAKQLTTEEVIRRHSQKAYQIAFLGFLPGFPYLTGLDPILHYPRKEKPSLTISQGAVAIGGEQTGIYPQASPGGWHVIGRTPIPLFDPMANPPSPFIPGDSIKFSAISDAEYRKIASQVISGTYRIKSISDEHS